MFSPTIEAALDSLAVSGFYHVEYNRDSVTYKLDRDKLLLYYRNFPSRRFGEAGISTELVERASLSLRDAVREIRQSADRRLLLVT